MAKKTTKKAAAKPKKPAPKRKDATPTKAKVNAAIAKQQSFLDGVLDYDTARTRVHTALDNALEGGVNQAKEDPAEVAQSLVMYDADLEDMEASSLIPHVIEWQTAHKVPPKPTGGLAAALTKKPEEPTALPHLIVEARAGTGKTTTLIEGLKILKGGTSTLVPSPQQALIWEAMKLSHAARSVCFVAFNNAIVAELQNRVPPGCDTKTMHRLGNQAVKKHFELDGKELELNRNRVQEIICNLEDTTIEMMRLYKPVILKSTIQLVGLCKMNLVHPWDDKFTSRLEDLVDFYDVDVSEIRDDVYRLTGDVLERCKEVTTDIDFNDMPWLPVALNLPVFKYDLLLVDEAQDLNRCSQALAKMAGHRLILCGDPKQAIYGFAGADSQSLSRMARELSCQCNPPCSSRMDYSCDRTCQILPLTVTRRCGKAIVAEARKLCPDFEAFPTNPEGKVLTMSVNTYHDKVEDHDMVICRTNAPLISQCFRFIRLGRVAKIRGKDVGEQLTGMIKKSKATTSKDFMDWLLDWRAHEEDKLKDDGGKKPSESKLEAIADRCECLTFIATEVGTTREMIAKIESLFSDDDNRPGIRLSSIHRSKGLEAKRVFFLKHKQTVRRDRMQPWEQEQEDNLEYVGRTRAIEELIYVR